MWFYFLGLEKHIKVFTDKLYDFWNFQKENFKVGTWEKKQYGKMLLKPKQGDGCYGTEAGRIMAPRRCPQPHLQTCEQVSLSGKSDFACMMMIKDLDMGSISWIIPVDPIQSLASLQVETLSQLSQRQSKDVQSIQTAYKHR